MAGARLSSKSTNVDKELLRDHHDDEGHVREFVFGLKATMRVNENGENDDTIPVDWLDLFYDLFFVSCWISLSNVVVYSKMDFNVYAVGWLIGTNAYNVWLFGCLWRSCINYSGYGFILVCVINVMGLLGIMIEADAYFANRLQLVYWMLPVHFSHIVLLVATVMQVPSSRSTVVYYFILSVIIPLGLQLATLSFPYTEDEIEEDNRRMFAFTLWGLAVTSDSLCQSGFWVFKSVRELITPLQLNVHHMMERFMLIIMICLGESIVGISVSLAGRHDTDGRVCGVAAGVTTCLLGAIKFIEAPHHAHQHAMQKSFFRAFLHHWLIRGISGSLVAFGVFAKASLKTIPYEKDHRRLTDYPGKLLDEIHDAPQAYSVWEDRRLGGESEIGYTNQHALRMLIGHYVSSVICMLLLRLTHKSPSMPVSCGVQGVMALLGLLLFLAVDEPVATVCMLAGHALFVFSMDIFMHYRKTQLHGGFGLRHTSQEKLKLAHVVGSVVQDTE